VVGRRVESPEKIAQERLLGARPGVWSRLIPVLAGNPSAKEDEAASGFRDSRGACSKAASVPRGRLAWVGPESRSRERAGGGYRG